MALTRPKIGQLQTSTSSISDPITVLHQGATSANVDVGFLFNRANGLVSNVALYWNETGNSFVTAFTGNTGVTDSNITVTSYASLITGGITASGNIVQTGTGYHTIPVGTTAQRPGTAASGMIRYNTTLSSFEGYGSAWSSLGGVKSVDGNTYILAEATVGAGDNTLWFYNNATNTARLSTSNLTLSQTTTSTSTTTGALIVGGGAGIAGAVNIGTSLTVDGGAYGNVAATQFGSVFATAYGPNNYSILQAWSSTTGGGLGFNAYGNIVYSAGAINFKTGAAIRDKDYPTGGTNGVQIAANGAIIASTGIASTLTGTGALIVTGGASISGNLIAPNFYGNISPTPGLSTVYTTGHVVPSANVVYDLGTPTSRYRSLYLSGNTIYLGNASITTTSSGDVIINNTGSFAVPVGTTNQRSAVQGAIRYNTTISAFESYDGTTWNKLAYGTVSDFPTGDYGDLTSTATDAFGAKTSTTTDCNSDGALTYVDLEDAGSAALAPI
jgi:hypothetical protein